MTPNLISEAQDRLAALVAKARSVSFDAFENAPSGKIQEDLFPQVFDLLRSSGSIVREVDDLAAERTAFEASPSPPTPRQLGDLNDLCFIVQTEITARSKRLKKMGPDIQPWSLLVATERACVEVSRGLCAVERELSELTGRESRTLQVNFLREALMARRASTKFRRVVMPEMSAPVDKILRSAGTALARMIGRDEFAELRVSDRITARHLHICVVQHLRGEEPDPESGLHLVDEIRNFAVLLSELNQREELLRHDVKVVNQSLEALAALDPHSPPTGSELERLNKIFGRDELLDELLVSGADVATVLARLLLLQHQLVSRSGSENSWKNSSGSALGAPALRG